MTNERALLERAIAYDPAALGELYDRYAPKMYAYIYRRVSDATLAEDLTSELFLRVLKAAGFRVEKLVPLDVTRQRALRHRWLLGGLRANGWIAVCR